MKPVAERAYDHYYDPVYTVSTKADYVRAHHQAQSTAIVKSANWSNFFSENVHHPAYNLHLKVTGPNVPAFPPRVAAGVTRATKAANAAPTVVLGKDRAKFFKRPLVPHLDAVNSDTILDGVNSADAAAADAVAAVSEPKSKTVGVQTLMRESEAQTDPYSPDYVLKDPSNPPEILRLQHLRYGQGLPATMDEVQNIQRLRDKAAREASWPDARDPESFAKRQQLLEEQELLEWSYREQEMQEVQERRLEAMVGALQAREAERSAYLEKRVERMAEAKRAQKESHVRNIQKKRVKVLRGLTKFRTYTESTETKRDIIAEYSNFSSEVYAPTVHEGHVPVQKIDSEQTGAAVSTKNYGALSALEQTSLQQHYDAKISAPGKIVPPSFASRQGQQILQQLHYVESVLCATQEKKNTVAVVPENIYKVSETLVRPPTPTVEPSTDEWDRAALALQRLIRGRAVQNMMHRGLQNCIELIRELQIDEQKPASSADAATSVQPVDLEEFARDAVQGRLISDIFANIYAGDILADQPEEKSSTDVQRADATHAPAVPDAQLGSRAVSPLLQNARSDAAGFESPRATPASPRPNTAQIREAVSEIFAETVVPEVARRQEATAQTGEEQFEDATIEASGVVEADATTVAPLESAVQSGDSLSIGNEDELAPPVEEATLPSAAEPITEATETKAVSEASVEAPTSSTAPADASIDEAAITGAADDPTVHAGEPSDQVIEPEAPTGTVGEGASLTAEANEQGELEITPQPRIDDDEKVGGQDTTEAEPSTAPVTVDQSMEGGAADADTLAGESGLKDNASGEGVSQVGKADEGLPSELNLKAGEDKASPVGAGYGEAQEASLKASPADTDGEAIKPVSERAEGTNVEGI